MPARNTASQHLEGIWRAMALVHLGDEYMPSMYGCVTICLSEVSLRVLSP